MISSDPDPVITIYEREKHDKCQIQNQERGIEINFRERRMDEISHFGLQWKRKPPSIYKNARKATHIMHPQKVKVNENYLPVPSILEVGKKG